MIRLWKKNNPKQYTDFEDFLFLFPDKHKISVDVPNDTVAIDGVNYIWSSLKIWHSQSDLADYEEKKNKNKPNGYAGLDNAGKILSNLLPALAISNVFVVDSEQQQDQLNVQTGDVAIRSDTNQAYIFDGQQWLHLASANAPVLSVDGRTGNVSLKDLYAPIIHRHNKIYGNKVQNQVWKPLRSGTRLYGYTTSTVQTNFKAPFDLSFNVFSQLVAQTFDYCNVYITVNGNSVYKDTSLNVVRFQEQDIRENTFVFLKNSIVVPKNAQVTISVHYPSSVTINSVVLDSSYNFVTYRPQKTNDISLFRRLLFIDSQNFGFDTVRNKVVYQANGLAIDDFTAFLNSLVHYIESNKAPKNAKLGQIWFNTQKKEVAIYTSQGWINLSYNYVPIKKIF